MRSIRTKGVLTSLEFMRFALRYSDSVGDTGHSGADVDTTACWPPLRATQTQCTCAVELRPGRITVNTKRNKRTQGTQGAKHTGSDCPERTTNNHERNRCKEREQLRPQPVSRYWPRSQPPHLA